MPPNPVVSIVLPTRNRADLLSAALASCLAQTYDALEVVVVDDGSTDGTAAVVAQCRAADERVRLIRRPPQGLVAALNVGFAAARGRYLTWTSDDNLYDRDAIQTMVAALETHPDVGLVYADQRVIDADGRVLHEQALPEPDVMAVEGGIGGCILYRRSVYEAVGNYSAADALNEDDEYVMRVARHAPLLRLPRVLYSYRLHPRSLTAQHGLEAVLVAARTRARYASGPAARRAAWARGWREGAEIALAQGRRGPGALLALRLARHDLRGSLGLLARAVLPKALVRRLDLARRLRRGS